jgi:8-oxo-(d)GTP phosphatase
VSSGPLRPSASPGGTEILIVRHGHAGSRARWRGDDRLRPLSDRGVAEAAALVDVLAAYDPVRIVSSPFERCRQTVEPLARRLGRTVEESARLEPDGGSAAGALVRELAGQPGPTVVCTHGETIGTLQGDLDLRGGTAFGRDGRREKASVWVLHANDGRFTSADYLPPPNGRRVGAPRPVGVTTRHR